MSQQLIDHSPDLKRLQDEGHCVEIRHNLLLVRDVPYVNGQKEVKFGILVSELTMAGDEVATPGDHTVYFAGEYPCDHSGSPLAKIIIESQTRELGENLVVNHRFSHKPVGTGKYTNYYAKMAAYVAILQSHAQAVDPSATAQSGPVVPSTDDDSPFQYMDTASARAGINIATRKLKLAKIAIIGVGGTGSYVLDLVAKTPVREIHLFDGDTFFSHNAFRSPGAASVAQLRAKPKKVAYFKELYSQMHRGIVAHDYYLDASNVSELQGMDFAFISIDGGKPKEIIVESLEKFGVPFVDVGMGVELVDDSLRGILRVTASTPAQRDHFKTRVSLADIGIDDEYDLNIQIADLNALNAALAVIKWKKHFQFYLDFEKEHHTTYSLNSNALINDHQA